MKRLVTKGIALAFVFVLALGTGCGRSSAPPEPLSVAELPAAFEKAFSKAKPEIKDLASQLVSALQSQNYSKAHADLQTLSGQLDLTKEQVSVTSRASLTVSTLLQEAQAKGDAKAAETLRNYHSNK